MTVLSTTDQILKWPVIYSAGGGGWVSDSNRLAQHGGLEPISPDNRREAPANASNTAAANSNTVILELGASSTDRHRDRIRSRDRRVGSSHVNNGRARDGDHAHVGGSHRQRLAQFRANKGPGHRTAILATPPQSSPLALQQHSRLDHQSPVASSSRVASNRVHSPRCNSRTTLPPRQARQRPIGRSTERRPHSYGVQINDNSAYGVENEDTDSSEDNDSSDDYGIREDCDSDESTDSLEEVVHTPRPTTCLKLPSAASWRDPLSRCVCCNRQLYEQLLAWMPAEYIQIGPDSKLRMFEEVRLVFWPLEHRLPTSTLYLICCYLAHRKAQLKPVPNVATARKTSERHSIAPYAFTADGRPFADYKSDFIPDSDFKVPEWYVREFGRNAIAGKIVLELDAWADRPILCSIWDALRRLDIASQRNLQRKKKHRKKDDPEMRSAWKDFERASRQYVAQQYAFAIYEQENSADGEYMSESGATSDEDGSEDEDEYETSSQTSGQDRLEYDSTGTRDNVGGTEKTAVPDSPSITPEYRTENRGQKRAAPADHTPQEDSYNRRTSRPWTCTWEILQHTDGSLSEHEVLVIND